MCGTWMGVLCFYLHQCLRLCGMGEPRVCGMSGMLACHLTGLYLVLIVTLLVSMGIFRGLHRQARAFGRDIGIARSVAQLVPQAHLGGSLALGHTHSGEFL